MTDALTLLLYDWPGYRGSNCARRALRRWRDKSAIPEVPDMDGLMAAMQDSHDLDGRDRLVYRLVVLAGVDRDACRVVLQALRPGLVCVSRDYARWWGREEASSMTVAAAVERIVTYPASRVDRPAAKIINDVRNRLYRVRVRELASDEALGRRAPAMELAAIAADEHRSAAEELQEVVRDALATQRITPAEAMLVLRQRVHDVPTAQVAEERGQRASTVRLHRRLAESKLTLITRSTYGLHPAVA